MEIDVTSRERNDLLEREELELAIDHTGEPTPSEDDIRSQLAAEQDLDPATIRVDSVYSATGRGTATGEVTVFDEPVVDLPDEDDAAEAAEEEAEEPADEEASTQEETEADEAGEDAEETEEDAEDTADADETAEEDDEDEEE